LCDRWEAKLVPVYLGRRDYWESFREFLGELGLAPHALAEVLDFARRKAAEVEQRTLFDGVGETLAALKARGLKLAVLSDTESRETRVRRRLAELGIEQHFDAVVTSIDIGCVKPQPEAFAAVLDRLHVSAAEAMFVGHDADELQGARQSGLTAVAFNHDDGVPANCYAKRFGDLLQLVGQP
jgi:HAD superfamily hydrolase (TIGR01509 family)